MLFERVKFLSEKRGKNIKTVALELELSENYFYSWKTSSPKTEVLQKIADYFDVSLDYLTGRSDNPEIDRSDAASESLDEMIDNAMFYNGNPLSDTDREIVKAFLEGKFGSK